MRVWLLAAGALLLTGCSVPQVQALVTGCQGKGGTTHVCFVGQELNGKATALSTSCAASPNAYPQMSLIGSVSGKTFRLSAQHAGTTPKEVAAFGDQQTATLEVSATGTGPWRQIGTSHSFQLRNGRVVFNTMGIPASAPTVFVNGEIDCPLLRPRPAPVPVQGSSKG